MTHHPTNHYLAAIRPIISTLLLPVLVCTLTIPLYGQICFPPHEGLPLGFIPPTMDGYLEPEENISTTERVEGGWKRSTRLTYMNQAMIPLMVYQGIKDKSQDFIYLSFLVRGDETFDDRDLIMIVFRKNFSPRSHSADERRIDINPVRDAIGAGAAFFNADDLTNNIRKNHTPRKVNLFSWDMTNNRWSNPTDVTPTEDQNNRARTASTNFPNSDFAVRSWTSSMGKNWSVEVKLPANKMLGGNNWTDLSDDFGLFFDVIRVCGNCPFMMPPPGGVGSVEKAYNVQYSWPRGTIFQDPPMGQIDLNTFEIQPTLLGEAFKGTNGNCRGVRFEGGQAGIGVRNPANPSGPLGLAINGALNANNTFVARLTNDGMNAATGVKATFRIANWGIIGDMAAAYDPIPAKPSSMTNKNPTDPVTVGAGRTELTVDWQIDATDRNSFKPNGGPRDPHQCIWVVLDANSDVEFADSSVHNNFQFINLSTYEEDAEISGKGLPPPPSGTDHDFILNVHQVQLTPLRDLIRDGRSPFATRGTTAVASDAPAITELEQLIYERQAQSKGVVTSWIWVVDAYRRTGNTLTIDGKTYDNYEPVGSFGYAANHEGRALGLKYSLTGPGLQQLGPNRYGLKVPHEGVVRIHTKLESIDAPGPQPGGAFNRWGLSLHAGASIPHGSFSNTLDPGPNFAVDLEYRLNRLFSLEGIYGLHHFNGGRIGTFNFPDVNLHQLSLNGKVYPPTSPVHPFFNFGVGAYHVVPSTRFGLNVGGGLQFDVSPNFAVETSYNFHNIFTSGSSRRFSTVQAGVRFRF